MTVRLNLVLPTLILGLGTAGTLNVPRTLWRDFQVGYRCRKKRELFQNLSETKINILQKKIFKSRDCLQIQKVKQTPTVLIITTTQLRGTGNEMCRCVTFLKKLLLYFRFID